MRQRQINENNNHNEHDILDEDEQDKVISDLEKEVKLFQEKWKKMFLVLSIGFNIPLTLFLLFNRYELLESVNAVLWFGSYDIMLQVTSVVRFNLVYSASLVYVLGMTSCTIFIVNINDRVIKLASITFTICLIFFFYIYWYLLSKYTLSSCCPLLPLFPLIWNIILLYVVKSSETLYDSWKTVHKYKYKLKGV